MRAIGIKLLKAKLSEYLRLVKAGEVVLVTDHDEVIAELRPASRQNLGLSSVEEIFLNHSEKGDMTMRSSDLNEWPTLKKLSSEIELPAISLLDQLRSDEAS